MTSEDKVVHVVCSSCGQQYNNHRVLKEVVRNLVDGPGEPVTEQEFHRFVECMGCGSIKYVFSKQWLDLDWDVEENVVGVYPDGSADQQKRGQALDLDEIDLPDKVQRMYLETIKATSVGIMTLAAGGLRATVEAICRDKGVNGGSLENKIDELERLQFLTPSQAELAHEERYLGNAALHELEMPSRQSVEDGLQIVEGLINTIYILPSKAERLRGVRANKSRGPKA